MTGIVSMWIRALPIVVMMTVFFGNVTTAADLTLVDSDRGDIPGLYQHLGQNIEREAGLYSEYIDYLRGLRLHDFREQLGLLNLKRDELIQRISSLEEQMDEKIPGSAYEDPSGNLLVFPDRTKSAGYVPAPVFFSHWRGFYLLVSAGFFLMNVSLLFTTCVVDCLKIRPSSDMWGSYKFYSKAA